MTGASGAWVHLRIAGYESPGADPFEDEVDADWLLIEALVRTAGDHVVLPRPVPVHVEAAELVSWLHGAAQSVVPVATAVVGCGSAAADDDEELYWRDRLPGGWVAVVHRVTHDDNRVEFLGALTAYVDHLQAEEASGWSDDEEALHDHGDTDT